MSDAAGAVAGPSADVVVPAVDAAAVAVAGARSTTMPTATTYFDRRF